MFRVKGVHQLGDKPTIKGQLEWKARIEGEEKAERDGKTGGGQSSRKRKGHKEGWVAGHCWRSQTPTKVKNMLWWSSDDVLFTSQSP